jgi:hypothetical protein
LDTSQNQVSFFYQVQLMISKGCEYSLPVVVTESTDSSKSSVSVDVETTGSFL